MLRSTCLICFLALAFSSQAQPAQDAEVHHLSGTVVDPDGQPIKGASISYFTETYNRADVDILGKFLIEIHEPAFVIRAPGYQSLRMLAQDGSGIEVRLEPLAGARQSFPVCSEASASSAENASSKISGQRLRLPESRQLSASISFDVDSRTEISRLEGVDGEHSLTHGWGFMWGGGDPSSEDVWNSVSYDERLFDVHPSPILDARGTLKNGKRWRLISLPGESIGYDGEDEQTAATFDAILDQVCFQPRAVP